MERNGRKKKRIIPKAEPGLWQHHKRSLELTKDLWNSFRQIDPVSNDDLNDFRFHLHALQNIIATMYITEKEHMTIKID